MEQQQALARIVRIAQENDLSPKTIGSALKAGGLGEGRNIVTSVFAYLGGIFVLAGLAIFINTFWDDFGSTVRIVSTLGTGYVLYVMALLASNQAPYAKAATPLFLLTAALQCGGFYTAAIELDFSWELQNTSILILSIMLLQSAATFFKTARTVNLFTSVAFAVSLIGTVLDKYGADGEIIGLVLGASLLCVTATLERGPHRALNGFWNFVGSIMLFWGSFELLEDLGVDILFLGLSCAMVYVSTLLRSRTLLFTSCGALLGYIGYYTNEHFLDSAGWPLSLIALGFIFISVSVLAVRIKNKFIE